VRTAVFLASRGKAGNLWAEQVFYESRIHDRLRIVATLPASKQHQSIEISENYWYKYACKENH